MSLIKEAHRVAAEFDYPAEEVNKGVKEFIREMDEGLQKVGATMSQIPTYVTAVPNGTEKGLYMAVDLGGTNFRVCSIHLNGDTTFSLTQSKVAIPRELMVAKTAQELFSFLARQIEIFLKTHHGDHYEEGVRRRKTMSAAEGYRDERNFYLGFTFSFPVQQIGINSGKLIRWTKGFDIEDAIGKDVCALLQEEIDKLHLPVKVAALVNDTVGTLMARSYTSPGKTGTLLGAIFGTGTNGAYVERLDKVTKMDSIKGSDYDKSTGEMIVNTEWGSFDNHMSVLSNTSCDEQLDRESVNPGIQMFEKRVSGMFLGEILRRAMLSMLNKSEVSFLKDEHSGVNDVHSTTTIADDSPLYQQWGLDTSLLSFVAEDHTSDLRTVKHILARDLAIDAASHEDAEVVKILSVAIGKRAARLSAVAMAAVVISTGRLTQGNISTTTTAITTESKSSETKDDTAQAVREEDVIDIGVDGSVVEYYPGFEEYLREALREIPEIGTEGEKRIRIGIAKDGSGVGAALIALVAKSAEKSQPNILSRSQTDGPA
ncbi:glucokinase [Lambiella insularis]|nr:glucokinase [Lambiella insularis]